MRGKHAASGVGSLREGLIPAHAGKTSGFPSGYGYLRAHPRSCGENEFLRRLNGRDVGSSPLMRGKRTRQGAHWGEERLIPAHAGKTVEHDVEAAEIGAHPRSCGENMARPDRSEQPVGSSPLMRGKPVDLHERQANLRLIPAHAGKTYPDAW